MYKIACIMGKSASGKDHIYKALLESKKYKKVVIYTTRPMREGECEGVEYHFTDEEGLSRLQEEGKVIELREYQTVHGPWKYFTANDSQIDLSSSDQYLILGTLESYQDFVKYYGSEVVLPIYVEVDDGIRLERALKRERKEANPKYEELCRRFLADAKDFSEEKLSEAGITKRFANDTAIEDCIAAIEQYLKEQMG